MPLAAAGLGGAFPWDNPAGSSEEGAGWAAGWTLPSAPAPLPPPPPPSWFPKTPPSASWAALPQQITVFMPAINPPQGAGRRFGQPWCHRTSHQLLGMEGGSRAAQRVGGWLGCLKTRAPQSWREQLPVPTHSGATPVSSPPSLVHGGSVPAWPWAGAAVGLAPTGEPLCLGAGGSEGRGMSASSGPPSSSRCSRDGGVRLRSAVPIPHGCPPSPASALAGPGCPSLPGSTATCALPGGRQPDQSLQGAGVHDLAFFLGGSGWAVTTCFPSDIRQPLAGTRGSGTPWIPQPGQAVTPWPQGCHPLCAGEHTHPLCWCPHVPQPALLPPHLLRAPSLPGTLQGSPRGCRCLPASHRSRPPARAGSPPDAIPTVRQDPGSPRALPAPFGGVLPARGNPNYLRLPGGVGAGVARGGGGGSGTAAPLRAKASSPSFFYLARCRWGQRAPAVPGAGGCWQGQWGRPSPAVWVGFFPRCIIIIMTVSRVFSIFNKASSPARPAAGRVARDRGHHGGAEARRWRVCAAPPEKAARGVL